MKNMLKGYDLLELSTRLVVDEALKRKIDVTLLDPSDNFIRLMKSGKTEYIKQATRTSADTYISPLIMENKKVTKMILAEKGISVPEGREYLSMEKAMADFKYFEGLNIVIKPNSTNFGTGINIIKNNTDIKSFENSLLDAFKYDNTILIENFVEGKEFRFLVIKDKVIGVLHRVPTNVTGDGASSIRMLVEKKNNDPRRGKGYSKPLEKIKIGSHEKDYLSENGLHPDFIPEKGQTIYLRKNSNISTGGDSIDYTDMISEPYKDIAVSAAKAVGAVICGVDMIITDIDSSPEHDNHAIIELNFNPALHIHAFPYTGKNRMPEKYVLDLLGF